MTVPVLPAKNHGAKSKNTLPAGQWLESSTSLSLRLELRAPIVSHIVMDGVSIAKAIFAHAVVVTSPKNDHVAKLIQNFVAQTNSRAFGLDLDSPRRDLNLSTFMLGEDQRRDPKLDIITGYDVYDSKSRVFFLEGLVDGSLDSLLATLNAVDRKDSFRIFHSSSVTFYERCWKGLSPALLHIRLTADLSTILAKASSFLHDRMSQDCIDCLNLLYQTFYLESLSIQTKMATFPSQRMITALLNSFGQAMQFPETLYGKVLNESDDLSGLLALRPKLDAALSESNGSTIAIEKELKKGISFKRTYHTTSAVARIDRDNSRAYSMIEKRKAREPNFNALLKCKYPGATPPRERTRDHSVYNYSMQAHSTTTEQLSALREKFLCDPTTYHSFNLNYFSQMVSPVEMEDEAKLEEITSRRKWLTKSGFDTRRFKPLEMDITDQRRIELGEPWSTPKSALFY